MNAFYGSRVLLYSPCLGPRKPAYKRTLSPHNDDLSRQWPLFLHYFWSGVQSDLAEGSLWRDPPNYWEQIVYPAYVEAHKEVFVNGDVEHGVPTDKVKDLILLETLEMKMGEAVDLCCRMLKETALKLIRNAAV